MPYEGTLVPIAKTQKQIKHLLAKHDVIATRFTSFPAFALALLEFVRKTSAGSISYRITVKPKLPERSRSPNVIDKAERQVWRMVYWWLKSKLEFEQDFLPYMLLSDGRGKTETAAELFFDWLAGRLKPGDDPFGGLRPALPPGDKGPEA